MKTSPFTIVFSRAVLLLFATVLSAKAQTFSLLHTFGPSAVFGGIFSGGYLTNGDGVNPCRGLAVSGGTLYGAANNGGTNGSGTLFAITTNGTFSVLYTFPTDTNDGNTFGANPNGGLVLSNATLLYGTTSAGGTSDEGVIFSISTNGTGIINLHNFTALANANSLGAYSNADGAVPSAGLVLSGVTLYGTAAYGGIGGNGVVFSYNTSNKVFSVLHAFTAGNTNLLDTLTNSDGANPFASLILSGNLLYGTTSAGGTNGTGTVFVMNATNTASTNITVLHHFDANYNGSSPYSELALSGGTLFGMGGTVLYALNTNGTGFTVLEQFGSQVDGATFANSGLTLYGSTLYGVVASGGVFGNGETFSMITNDTGFADFHDFTPTPAYPGPYTNYDGTFPNGGLALTNGALYGTASQGGYWGNGTIFELTPPIELLPSQLSGRNFLLSFQTFGGMSYTVQQNTNLAGTNWIAFTNFAGSGTVTQFMVPTTNAPWLFFRVRQP